MDNVKIYHGGKIKNVVPYEEGSLDLEIESYTMGLSQYISVNPSLLDRVKSDEEVVFTIKQGGAIENLYLKIF